VDAIVDNLDAYRQGFVTTLALTALSSLLALALGTLLAAMRVSPVPTLRGAGAAYVDQLGLGQVAVAILGSLGQGELQASLDPLRAVMRDAKTRAS
jgi:ABC-type amino acid transport system permease subunit